MRLSILPFLGLTLLACSCSGNKDSGGGGGVHVGTHKTFWSWNLGVMPPVDQEVTATARAVTTHSYLFVQDSLWSSGLVTQSQLDDFAAALETATPAGSIDPGKGIVDNDVATFGPIPDVLDGDPHVYVLLMNIANFQSFTFDGFFRSLDELTDADAMATQGYHSNEVEMLFMNAAIRPINSATTESVVAHELVHLLEYGSDQDEDPWLSESWGELGMTINGYYTDQAAVADFLAHPETGLEGGQFSVDYGPCLLWSDYLYQRFGAAFVSHLVSLPANGFTAIDQALGDLSLGTTSDQLFQDWIAANGAHAPGAAGGKWGYTFTDLPIVSAWQTLTTNPSSTPSIAVGPYSARYVKITGLSGTAFNATVTTTAAASQRIAVIRYLSTNRDTVDVTFPAVDASNTTVVPVDLTTTYDEALIALVGTQGGTFTLAVGP